MKRRFIRFAGLPALLALVGPMACADKGAETMDRELDYEMCEYVQPLTCGEDGCGTETQAWVLGVVMEEFAAVGAEDRVYLSYLDEPPAEGEGATDWVAVGVTYEDDWVKLLVTVVYDGSMTEDQLRDQIRWRLDQDFAKTELIGLAEVQALLDECAPELEIDPCTGIRFQGEGTMGLRAEYDNGDGCTATYGDVNLRTGAVTCGQVDYCEGDTPLVLKFDDAPVAFAPAAAGTSFDIAGAGACTTHDWPAASTPWLALDRDHNGQIDSGAELFGSGTVLASGDKASNGFEALAELDTNGDGQITRSDAGFHQLVLWSDHDGDKRSTFAETPSAADLGLLSIELNYDVAPSCDARGNCEVEQATFRFVGDHGTLQNGVVSDVHLPCQ